MSVNGGPKTEISENMSIAGRLDKSKRLKTESERILYSPNATHGDSKLLKGKSYCKNELSIAARGHSKLVKGQSHCTVIQTNFMRRMSTLNVNKKNAIDWDKISEMGCFEDDDNVTTQNKFSPSPTKSIHKTGNKSPQKSLAFNFADN